MQTFQVNSLNELTTETNGGTLTVMGTTTPIATNVTVNSSNAVIYGDSTFAATNMPPGTNYMALALGNGLAATNSVTVNLASNAVFQYDGNGNLTNDGLRNFVYDDENQLIQVSVSNQWMSQFVYDAAMRRRIRKEYSWQSGSWAETNEIHYVYDGNVVVQETSSNDVVLVTYARGMDLSGSLQGAGGIGGLLARTDTNGPTYYHADGIGNIMILVNASQVPVAKYLYDAFGNLISKTGSLADANLYRFSSKEAHLNSGMVYYLYRFYDPNLQRWLNRDPIEEGGGINLYSFVANASPNNFDYNGLIGGSWGGILTLLFGDLGGEYGLSDELKMDVDTDVALANAFDTHLQPFLKCCQRGYLIVHFHDPYYSIPGEVNLGQFQLSMRARCRWNCDGGFCNVKCVRRFYLEKTYTFNPSGYNYYNDSWGIQTLNAAAWLSQRTFHWNSAAGGPAYRIQSTWDNIYTTSTVCKH